MMLFLAMGKNCEMVSCQEQLKAELQSVCVRETGGNSSIYAVHRRTAGQWRRFLCVLTTGNNVSKSNLIVEKKPVV